MTVGAAFSISELEDVINLRNLLVVIIKLCVLNSLKKRRIQGGTREGTRTIIMSDGKESEPLVLCFI